MNVQRLAIIITLLNAAILMVLLAQGERAVAQPESGTLRGHALEIVDDHGRIRARINVEPATTTSDGTTYPESVVFRLTDPDGRIRVKLGADSDGSGFLLANRTQQPGIHMLAKGTGASLRLVDGEGEKTVTP